MAQLDVDIKNCNKKLAYYINRWKHYSLSFHIEAMQAHKYWYPTLQQHEMCKLLDKGRFMAVAAARGVGKTWFEAVEIFRHMICFRIPGLPTKVLISGPTGGQMSDVIWAEVSAAHEHLLPWLQEQFVINQDGMYCIENPANWRATPRTAKKEAPGGVQGQHGSTLNVYDEGSQIPDEIFHVSTASHTQRHARAIITGNPDKLKGFYYRVFNEMTGDKWQTYFIDAYDCLDSQEKEYPYIDPCGEIKTIKVFGLITEQWVQDQKDALEETSALYTAYVRGRFPINETNQLIKRNWISRCWENVRTTQQERKRIMGFDPGYEIDPSAYVVRKGLNVEECDEWQGQDPQVSSDLLAARFDEFQASNRKIDFICIDTIGIGAGVYGILLKRGYPVISVKASEIPPASGGTECRRTRDWLWWQARNFFRDYRPHFEEDTELMKKLAYELSLPGYKFENGKVVVDSKKEMKNAGHKSPNLADAFNLTFKVDFISPIHHSNIRNIDPYRRLRRGRHKTQSWKVA